MPESINQSRGWPACLGCLLWVMLAAAPPTAHAGQPRAIWYWSRPSTPNGLANTIVDPLKRQQAITNLGAWEIGKVYSSVSNLPVTNPAVVAAWNTELHAVGIESQFLTGNSYAYAEPQRTNLLNNIQNRLIDFNNAQANPDARFDALHLDIEPHTIDAWDDGDGENRREILYQLRDTFSAIRGLLDSEGLSDVGIYADIPVWWDSSSSIDWGGDSQRDQWFSDIGESLDGLSMMAYERSSLSSMISGVSYEANNFDGEVRVGINVKEVGPGDTFEDYDEYITMANSLDAQVAIPIGGVDHHSYTYLEDTAPTPQISADFDGNGRVNGKDFLAWQRGFGTMSGATPSTGDADGNGVVNLFDQLAWESQFGAATPPAIAVPEPVTLGACLLTGVCAKLFFPPRKR